MAQLTVFPIDGIVDGIFIPSTSNNSRSVNEGNPDLQDYVGANSVRCGERLRLESGAAKSGEI
jgi:hypothetical protein